MQLGTLVTYHEDGILIFIFHSEDCVASAIVENKIESYVAMNAKLYFRVVGID